MTSEELNRAIQFLIDHEARLSIRFEVLAENMTRLVQISEIQSRRLDRAEKSDREAQKRDEEFQRRQEKFQKRQEEFQKRHEESQKRNEDFQREALHLLYQILDRLIPPKPNLN
jgi:hypothetical protein